MPAGRPQTYGPEFIESLAEKAEEYFGRDGFETIIVGEGDNAKAHRVPRPFPTLARFALDNGILRETLYEWANRVDDNGNPVFPRLAHAIKRTKEYQEALLVEGALLNVYAPAFSIFFAKNNLGWKDKVETEVTGKNGGAVQIEDKTNMTIVEEAKRIVFLLAAAQAEQKSVGMH
jgi:hypothetical protein